MERLRQSSCVFMWRTMKTHHEDRYNEGGHNAHAAVLSQRTWLQRPMSSTHWDVLIFMKHRLRLTSALFSVFYFQSCPQRKRTRHHESNLYFIFLLSNKTSSVCTSEVFIVVLTLEEFKWSSRTVVLQKYKSTLYQDRTSQNWDISKSSSTDDTKTQKTV